MRSTRQRTATQVAVSGHVATGSADAPEGGHRRAAEIVVIPGVDGGLVGRLPRKLREVGQLLLCGQVSLAGHGGRGEDCDVGVLDAARFEAVVEQSPDNVTKDSRADPGLG